MNDPVIQVRSCSLNASGLLLAPWSEWTDTEVGVDLHSVIVRANNMVVRLLFPNVHRQSEFRVKPKPEPTTPAEAKAEGYRVVKLSGPSKLLTGGAYDILAEL